ncbi:DUF6452 family protein [Sabulilitoribacter multivorans]|uniref:DUF6452 family protein n=1 Tax=Flaviramulus multivorans TaxID=1304750 RepID=A0ABS9IJY6_9FLAO|nr:DUF6452 family protein [Flaviramulus multivorans]MCF7560904.1 DUF6452 family protein [Flaviramulus multivorans]
MKYFKVLIIPILLIAVLSISCERDDICPESTPTTPRLIIEAYDFDNQESSKNIFGLVVAGVDNESVLAGYNIVSTNELVLPLKTDDNTTQYTLISGASINDNGTPNDTSDDFYNGNYDTITINYSREEVYVSRACGYKIIFKNVTITIEPDGDNWILSQQPLNANQSVEDETTAHFNIFH